MLLDQAGQQLHGISASDLEQPEEIHRDFKRDHEAISEITSSWIDGDKLCLLSVNC